MKRGSLYPSLALAIILAPWGFGCGGGSEKTDRLAPSWPADAVLRADAIGSDRVELSWTAAEDNAWVTGYRLLRDGSQELELDGTTSAAISGLSPETEYLFSVQAGDAAGNWSADGPSLTLVTASELPPDPADIAPALAAGLATDLRSAVAFLFTGDAPIQRGVDPVDIDGRRVAVLRGTVLDEAGQALPGARVSVLGRPEFGWTISRADGGYDLAVNGGEALVVRVERDGRLPAQRKLTVPWRDYVHVPTVRLVPPDAQVTSIDLAAGTQTARALAVDDADGARQATLLVPSGVQAALELPDGGTRALADMNVRATEYTVGPAGPQRMPAGLPPNSGYTYAVDLRIDEADAAGATGVTFDRPLYFYLENFLDFPVGTPVPMGYYDQQRGVWVPSESGRVVEVVEVQQGRAALDTDGDGQEDDADSLAALGVTEEELAELGGLYAAGTSLWRVGITHFSPWDCNWGFGPPVDGEAPGDTPEQPGQDDDCQQEGSTIATIAGRSGAHVWDDEMDGGPALEAAFDDPRALAVGRRGEVYIAAGGFVFEVADGTIHRIGGGGFDHEGEDVPATEVVLHRPMGLAFAGTNLYVAEDSHCRVRVIDAGGYIKTVAGTGECGFAGDGGPAVEAQLELPYGLAASPDGSLYIADRGNHRIRKVRTDGTITTVIGDGDCASPQEGQLAADASVCDPESVALGPDGTLYFTERSDRIFAVAPDGIVRVVAGTGVGGYSGDGGPAVEAQLSDAKNVAVRPDGRLFIRTCRRVRIVDQNGIISTLAGGGDSYEEGGPALGSDLG